MMMYKTVVNSFVLLYIIPFILIRTNLFSQSFTSSCQRKNCILEAYLHNFLGYLRQSSKCRMNKMNSLISLFVFKFVVSKVRYQPISNMSAVSNCFLSLENDALVRLLNISLCAQSDFLIALICISLIHNDVEHLFTYLQAFHLS